MSELEKIILTSSITVIIGAVVFVLGHFGVALFVQPIQRLRTLIGDIDDALDYYHRVYTTPQYSQATQQKEASEKFKYQASQLRSSVNIIPWYTLWNFLSIVYKKKRLYEATKELLKLSSNIATGQPTEDTEIVHIRTLLGLKTGV